MQCLFYLAQVGCEFDSQATAAWVQAVGSLIAIVGAAIFPYYHQKKMSAYQKRDQAKRIQGLIDIVYPSIQSFIEHLNSDEVDTLEFMKRNIEIKELNFVSDKLEELKSSDCPSPEMVRSLHEFKKGLRGFNEQVEGVKIFYKDQAIHAKKTLLFEIAFHADRMQTSYADIANEPQKYR